MNFLFFTNGTGTYLWRVNPIAEALEKQGHQVVSTMLNQITEDKVNLILEWADVLTFQLVCAKDLLIRAKQKGIYTIFDCDDLIEEVPESHPSFKATKKRGYKKQFRETLEEVDLITVATDVLYKKYKKYGEIVKIENYLPDYWERPHTETNTLRIGWAGGMSHQEDLDFIAPVIKKIIEKNPQVKFVYTGGGGWNTGNPDSIYSYEKDHFESIPVTRREYYTGSKPELWPDRLNSMRLDIALAPLDENNFSKCKSQIKYYEYAINHWPGVYQDFLYKNVKHGETGYLAGTPDEWEAYIQKLIDDPSLRKDMGERAYSDIKNHYTFFEHRDEWLGVYNKASERSKHRDTDFILTRG